ncbi:MAG: cellulase family glycosylhydrolase [Alphaproteobacteria bacterium]|nr:cellulase family glycosylhydrolase [Alphaproteobacteria bacterium]
MMRLDYLRPVAARRFVPAGLVCAFLALASVPAAASDWLSVRKPIGESLGSQIGLWRTSPGNDERTHTWESTPKDMDMMKALGFHWFRSGAEWQELEPELGTFQWDEADDLFAEARERGLAIVFTLGGGHPAFTKIVEGARYKRYEPPVTKEAIQAFASFAAAAVRRYGGDDVVWEIWNEPDMDWQPKPDAVAYAELASAVCEAIRQVAPHAKVIGPAFANFPGLARDDIWSAPHRNFVAALLRSPAGACLDAISVHSYQRDGAPPEAAFHDYEGAKTFIAKNTLPGRKILPAVSTEWGYTTTKVTPEEQAAYALRTHLVNLLSGTPLSLWYEWRDSPRDPADPESHYGLLGVAREDKPAYGALNAVLPKIRDAVIERRLLAPDPDNFVLLLRQPDGRKDLIAWSARQPSGPPLAVRVQQEDGFGYYPLSGMPAVIEDVKDVSSIALAARPQATKARNGEEGR